MAPSCHHCLLRWFCKVHTVAFTGHKWPKKIILGQARLFAIHVYLAQEWVVSYAKIQIYMLDRIKIIEETVIRKQINFLLCQPYQCGKAQPGTRLLRGGKGQKGGKIGKLVGSGGLESRLARQCFCAHAEFSPFPPNAQPGPRLGKAFYAHADQISQISPRKRH